MFKKNHKTGENLQIGTKQLHDNNNHQLDIMRKIETTNQPLIGRNSTKNIWR